VRLAGLRSGALARAVDGGRGLDQIIECAVADGMTAEDATRIAGKWLAAGHLVAGEPAWLTPRRLRVIGDPELAGALATAGVLVVDKDPEIDLVVCEQMMAASAGPPLTTPTVYVQLRGRRVLISPVVGPGAACRTCLVTRLRNAHQVEVFAARRVGRELPPPLPMSDPAAVPIVAGLLAAIAGQDEPRRAVTVIDPGRASVSVQALTPVAGCPDCDPDGSSVRMLHLTHTPRRTPADSEIADSGAGLRVVDPDVTWQRYEHLVGDVVGIVGEVRQTGELTMRAFSAGMNIAAVDDLMVLKSRLRSAAGGKGTTVAAARAAALAEALERDSLRARGDEPHRRALMADLPGAIHPNDIQLYSQRQLERAEHLLALGLEDPQTSGFHFVPARFDTQVEHDWSPVADLVTGQVHWLPSALLWLGWPATSPGYPRGCSNGAAAGNTIAEALLQGLLELVERDSVALWWQPRCRRPEIDLQAFDDPRIDAALAPQRALGTDVWVLDVTTDLGIPAAVAVGVGLPAFGQAPLMGYGAHVDPVIAVVRALTELAQMQAPFSAMPAGTHIDFPGHAERVWFTQVSTESEPWLAPRGMVAPQSAPGHDSVDAALEDVLSRLTTRGLQVLWADCTRPDVGLPVVRTFVPGLRHFWQRLGPGRIYNVPAEIGWCEPGYTEEDLNPRAMIL
jgi:ribosomal protein S12 methylthiotransferase accessory factor